MIPAATITEWSRQVPWPSVDQVEQDLLLSRLIVEIANDDYLGNELIFRGGTCLHKLVAPTPLRYSEDLDYVRTTSGGIREFTRAVTSIGDRLGMQVTTSEDGIRDHDLMVRWRGSSADVCRRGTRDDQNSRAVPTIQRARSV